MILNLLFSSVPLLLASTGALFSEYAGALAVFIDGIINFSAFLTYTLTVFTGNIVISSIISALISSLSILAFAWLSEKLKMNRFLTATALNLIYSSLCSLLSSLIFHTRGVLSSPDFSFNPLTTKIAGVSIAFALIFAALIFILKTPHGLYLRITATDSDVLEVKGISSARARIYAWGLSAVFASFAGSFLAIRISSFVPNISAGRGWIALAAVFIGRKKIPLVVLATVIFCAADFAGITLQSVLPSAAVNSVPYLAALILIALTHPKQSL